MPTTATEYQTLDDAYRFFNRELFDSQLPDCLITLQREGTRTLGYYHPERFEHRSETARRTDEIALNPDAFEGRTDEDILGTLVHEMAHVWQWHHGTPSRGGYHNKQWAAKMTIIGLVPSNTGEPGGKQTGQQMSHYIEDGGSFQIVCGYFLEEGKHLQWNGRPDHAARGNGGDEPKPKPKSKVKFTCPLCNQNAWAKPTANLICGICNNPMEAQE